jgi:hypothetical protein
MGETDNVRLSRSGLVALKSMHSQGDRYWFRVPLIMNRIEQSGNKDHSEVHNTNWHKLKLMSINQIKHGYIC